MHVAYFSDLKAVAFRRRRWSGSGCRRCAAVFRLCGPTRMATITKKDMLDRIASRLNLPPVQVKRVVQMLLDEIVVELLKNNRLEFRDFGVFECRSRPPRIAQNPKTLRRIAVPGRRRIRFKAGRRLKKGLSAPVPDEAVPPRLAPAGVQPAPAAAPQPAAGVVVAAP